MLEIKIEKISNGWLLTYANHSKEEETYYFSTESKVLDKIKEILYIADAD